MGQKVLGGALLALGRGISGFQEAKERKLQSELDKRFSILQFKELGLRIEKAEFDRDKRKALGTPEEQAMADQDFEAEMRTLDREADKLDRDKKIQDIATARARELSIEKATSLMGLKEAPEVDDRTKELLASMKSQKKVLEGQLDDLIDEGADEELILVKAADIENLGDLILKTETEVQEAILTAGAVPEGVRSLFAEMNASNVPPANIKPAPPQTFGTGEPDKPSRVPFFNLQSTQAMGGRLNLGLDNLFKSGVRTLNRLKPGPQQDLFAKTFRFKGTDSQLQPGSLSPEVVQQALEAGIIEEIPPTPPNPLGMGSSVVGGGFPRF